jgi:5-methylcytosine-specific restriction endonuclease McrA
VNILKRADAVRLGLKQYFTGKACPHGHLANRYVNGKGCVVCAQASRLRWAIDNPEKAGEQKKRQYQAHKEVFKEKAADRRRVKAEEISASKRESYARNRAAVLASVRNYAEKNRPLLRAKNKLWRTSNRDLVAEIDRNKRARRRGAPGSHTAADIQDISRMQRGRCAYCKCKLSRVNQHVDHIIALVRGGSNDRSNLQLLCRTCNLSKHARDPIEFVQTRGLLI